MKVSIPSLKHAKRIVKRKKRNKHRRLLRQEQRQNSYKEQTADVPLVKAATNKRRNSNSQASYEQITKKCRCDAAHLWQATYVNALRWHSEHQMHFWRQRAEQLKQQNFDLRRLNETLLERGAPVSHDENLVVEDEAYREGELNEYVDEEVQEENESTDEGYLDFLEVTLKHRAELREKRAREAAEEDDEDVNIS